MFNDRPVTNRVFAYLTNFELRQYNELETDILKRLDYSALIDTEMYQSYKEHLEEFCETQSDSLVECYQEYMHDKKLLREIKRDFMEVKFSRERDEFMDISPCSNYTDPHITETMGKMNGKTESFRYIDSSDKFRFESYDCQNFKTKYRNKNRRLIESHSLPLLSG
jgi:hypothetical protein